MFLVFRTCGTCSVSAKLVAYKFAAKIVNLQGYANTVRLY